MFRTDHLGVGNLSRSSSLKKTDSTFLQHPVVSHPEVGLMSPFSVQDEMLTAMILYFTVQCSLYLISILFKVIFKATCEKDKE